MTALTVKRVEQQDFRLGRQMVHDSRSRNFVRPTAVDRTTWRTKVLRTYDPTPNPNQSVGNCTGVSKAVTFNTAGERKKGRILTMDDALNCYHLASGLDPWPGSWPPDDTGSSGLAAAKAAQQLGWGGEYLWLFGGADEVVQAVMDGDPVSVGTWWRSGMFDTHGGKVLLLGDKVGGHQWTVRGYNAVHDTIIGRCWWGAFRDFEMRRVDLQVLLDDGGDAHVQAPA